MNRQGKKEHSASVHPVSNHTSKRALYGFDLLMLWTIAYCATIWILKHSMSPAQLLNEVGTKFTL